MVRLKNIGGFMIVFVVQVIDVALRIYSLIILVRCLLSFFSPDPHNQLYRLLIEITEPVMAPVRRFVPAFGTLDLSPIVVMLLISVARAIIPWLLLSIVR